MNQTPVDPTKQWFLIFSFYVVCVAFIYSRQYDLPKPLPASVPNTTFSEERATRDLFVLAQDIGSRPLVSVVVEYYNCS
jgi:hypothetical protein